MRKCSDMPYHIGVVLKLYLSDEKKRLVAVNAGAQRSVYNHLVACNNEIYRLKKTAAYVPSLKMPYHILMEKILIARLWKMASVIIVSHGKTGKNAIQVFRHSIRNPRSRYGRQTATIPVPALD